ncbi:hypothetical protein PFTANZ_06284, partial [Plasmodium falciparum Tanzania (2000708)]
RRKLYIGKIKEWAEIQLKSQVGGDGDSSSSSETPSQPSSSSESSPEGASPSHLRAGVDTALRDAFIQSAAVETFFLWHRYKKEWEQRNKKSQNEVGGVLSSTPYIGSDSDDSDPDPQTQLQQTGTIPTDFLRLMFYTLGDYRDICVGNTNIVEAAVSSTEDQKTAMKKIQEKIQQILPKNGGTSPGGNDPKTWWERNAKDIWEGMLCALSYNTENITKDEEVSTQLTKKKKSDYDYNKVKFIGGPNDGTTLSKFVEIPQFIRWFEEWSEDFCRKRKYKLKELKEECNGVNENGYQKYCSGDGYVCADNELRHNDMFAGLDCPGCHEKCRKYKKWIKNKEKEFDNQRIKYVKEFQKLKANSINNVLDQKFYNYIKNHSSVDKFLSSLNQGKECEDNSDQDNKIDFSNPQKMFNPSTYCKACPLYGVTCSDTGECTVKIINNENDTKVKPTDINILVDDSATKETDNDLEKYCTTCRLYKDLRKQKWECQYMNEIYKCELKNLENSQYYDEKIPFNILFHRWLIDFIQYYNKSKKEITRCRKKGENKCDCIQKWLNKKSKEWDTIKKYYKQNFQSDDEHIASRLNSFFEQGPFYSLVEEAKKVVDEENKRDGLWGCTGNITCDTEEDQKELGDFITNLIKELQKKIGECKSEHSGKPPQTSCEMPPLSDDENPEPLDPDDDNLVDDAQHRAPRFCPKEDICKDGKVDCTKVGKGNSKLIHVPIDPDNTNGKSHRNKDGNGTNCAGIPTGESNIKWKNNEDNEYTILSEGIYVSPRRQKLCVKGLQEAQDQNDLRDKLLTAAANDAYNLAIKYNDYKDNYTVPPCHALKYSFYDYQHMILGKDPLEPDNNGTGLALKTLFGGNTDDGKPGSEVRKDFWDKYKSCVWSAMKCGYEKGRKNGKTNAPSIDDCKNDVPTEFDGFSQFFMWFTEWSEDFCNQRKKQLEILKDKCDKCDVNHGTCKNESECKECQNQCKKYKDWLATWKGHYNKQKVKFKTDKEYPEYKKDGEVQNSDNGYEYLNKKLEKFCQSGTSEKCNYNCMNETSSTNNEMPKSMDDEPEEVRDKCSCVPDECNALSVNDSGFPDVSVFGGGVSDKKKCKGFEEHLPKKMESPQSDRTNDILKTTIPVGIALALGSIAFLYLK